MRLFALVVGAAVVAAAAAGGGAGQDRLARDDTSWLQARLDAGGGRIFLPKLANGACYATRGLWVSHDRTQIVSNGACIRSLGPGPVRLVSPDGDPVASDAVFFVNRSRQFDPTPIHVTLSDLRIVVPAETRTYGIAIFGHEVVVRNVTVEGSPVDDVYVGDRANGDGYSSRVSILGCRLSGGGRNVLSAVSFIGLRIAGNRITGASNSYRPDPGGGGNPSAGIDIEPNSRGELERRPALDHRQPHPAKRRGQAHRARRDRLLRRPGGRPRASRGVAKRGERKPRSGSGGLAHDAGSSRARERPAWQRGRPFAGVKFVRGRG
jgi:hypothetical protein